MTPRLFLVAPETIAEALLLDCAKAACAAADCATILVAPGISQEAVEGLQALDLAVILNDAEVRQVHYLKADGLLMTNIEDVDDARKNLKTEVLGFLAGASRHMAMEAAEAGADFVAYNGNTSDLLRGYEGDEVSALGRQSCSVVRCWGVEGDAGEFEDFGPPRDEVILFGTCEGDVFGAAFTQHHGVVA